MAVIAINKILDEVRAKYLPSAKVPLVVIAAEMQMFLIDQVITQGWPFLQAILKPGPEVSTHIWAQVPKSILKGKAVDPLEQGGTMEAGGSKLEGKQASDGNQGGKGGEKGKRKKEKKEKKEKKIERVAKGFDGGQESWDVASESGGPISGGDSTQSQSQSQSLVSKPWKLIDAKDEVQPEASKSSKPTATQALLEPPSPQPFNNSCNHCIRQTKDCTRKFEKGILVGACVPCHQAKLACNLSQLTKRPREELRAPIQAPEVPKAPSPGPSKGPACQSAWATLKPPVTPSKRAPSLGPGSSPSKKAKASVSKLRPKTPSVSQNANFANDVGVTKSGSIKVYHPLAGPPPLSIPRASALELITTPINPLLDPRPGPSLDPKDQIIKALEVCVASLKKQVERILDLELQLNSMARVVEALREQATGPACIGLLLDAETPLGNVPFPSEICFPHIGSQGSAPITPQPSPHLGVEMEDDASVEGSGDDAGPPLPIPPPLTDLVPPIESFSSEVDMELEDVDME
ncbi:hypothetical protein PAXRUDRAFT_19010 [Paxillus rubicundulus Ve08.2h10]|uniref:Zn(2)-C6 fungal-type domain-containing protein n=1 Tax=Paxillus rubicundulus Ve08.2h10 TaxID=930991 RepID=A0A0D0DDI3_9AGAM|nr:hypothetical protein PAXRUDRAFT_19010 [Paxillus rubicundulus Ve08.2h10]